MVVIFGVIRANEWYEVTNLERRRQREHFIANQCKLLICRFMYKIQIP